MKRTRCCDDCRQVGTHTPLPTANRPGLNTLAYRVGTHSVFFETMLARLSSHRLPSGERPLAGLTVRTPDDPSVALLDAWATIADVLTFYQERIANEGYLATATERKSVLELARLTGYRPRPGVAASVHLAFQMERDQRARIPAGTRAQSVPEDPGELPQSFETDEPFEGRAEWNALRPRLTRPSDLSVGHSGGTGAFHVEGAVTGLRSNDPLLLICGGSVSARRVVGVQPDPEADRTRVVHGPFHPVGGLDDLEGRRGSGGTMEWSITEGNASRSSTFHAIPSEDPPPPMARLSSLVRALVQEPSVPPPNRLQLVRPLGRVYGGASDLTPRLLTHLAPGLRGTLYAALGNAQVAGPPPSGACHVEVLRVSAGVFGHNAPPPQTPPSGPVLGAAVPSPSRAISLDAVYTEILPGSRVVVERADTGTFLVSRVESVRTRSRAAYGIAARVTELTLEHSPWGSEGVETLAALREMTVHALGERLQLAEEPIAAPVAGAELELVGVHDGLEPGRWLVVSGEREDVTDVGGNPVVGVEASELVMLAGIEHDVGQVEGESNLTDDFPAGPDELPGDTLHTRLILAEPLVYSYRRDSVHINANVVRASHGETHVEVLGSGEGGRAFQRFGLQRAPLTYRAAPTAQGVESTLEVRVDGVRWTEAPSALLLDPTGRGYLTERDEKERTTIAFGDGVQGPRLPTGVENVAAVYRSGIGRAGNVAAGAITLLATRPAGVKGVENPIRSSGGADPESLEEARRNVPVAVQSLDRLVSVEDYAAFARTFAGIGKAAARRLPEGRRQVVHLTIAGAGDVPIDRGSDLLRNLNLALRRFGDPGVPLQVDRREAVVLFLGAGVRVLEDHRWEEVEPVLRSALLDAFGFERRELGQGVRLGEVMAVMQAVRGVDHVDVDFLEGVSEAEAFDPERLSDRLEGLTAAARGADLCQPRRYIPVRPAGLDPVEADPERRIHPAQLAFFDPGLPDTLVLTELER